MDSARTSARAAGEAPVSGQSRGRRLGVDIGSLYLGCALLEDGVVSATRYVEHHGDWAAVLADALADPALGHPERVGCTASSGATAEGALDATLAFIEGARFLYPGCRNVISIGGESYCLVFYDEEGRYVEHSVNPPCAAGTGSFVEQQAQRLGIGVAFLAEHAAAWTGPTPRIATRCAVFAKTDIIHAQQGGFTSDAICAGLCDGIARSLCASLVKGRTLRPPVGLVGGVAQNRRIAQALGAALGLTVQVSPYAAVAGAIGAALLGDGRDAASLLAIQRRGRERRASVTRPPLALEPPTEAPSSTPRTRTIRDVEVLLAPPAGSGACPRPTGEGCLGIDVGSTSTKAVLLDAEGAFVAGFYTATRGQPLAAVERLAAAAREALGGDLPPLRGACTTGSGRKLVGVLHRADMEVDEISAHARAAVELYPEVDTIIEIGGQDSKFTRLQDGKVTSATMNYVCAAGTGSFIEEQARRLGVDLQELSELALGVVSPYTSDRCTVYMERDSGSLLAEGWSTAAVAAAVVHSVRDNYMAKVVGRSGLGEHIVFQGATARNEALVAAFRTLLGRPVRVSPFCHLTGALGAALLCRDLAREPGGRASRFRWGAAELRPASETCTLCANHCLLTVAESDGEKVGWGMKCGREYAERATRRPQRSAFERRYREHFGRMLEAARQGSRPTIGVPTALYHATYAPLWVRFLSRLGFPVVTTPSSAATLASGKELVNSDFCAPMVVAHGQLRDLLEEGAQYIFCPAIENEFDEGARESGAERLYRKKTRDTYYCYYSQYLPTVAEKLTALDLRGRLIAPLLSWNRLDTEGNVAALHGELLRFFPTLQAEEVRASLLAGLDELAEARARWGRTLRAADAALPAAEDCAPLKVVLLGRPYVTLDPVLHLGIPRRLEELGAEVYWQEEVDTAGFEPLLAARYLERMHWHYGRRILQIAEIAARSPNLFVVYVSCFRCSPDSFLLSYVKDIMEHERKPHLVLQLDELASDVGYTTRIEAALRSFRLSRSARARPALQARASGVRKDLLAPGDTVLLPHVDEIISTLWAECLRAAGYGAVVLRPDERTLSVGYRYANGGECMPLVSILGATINAVRDRALEAPRTYLHLPTICMGCNFPQFPILGAYILEAAGLAEVKVGLTNTMAPAESLPLAVTAKMLESQVTGSLLHKLYNRLRPYERIRGSAEDALTRSRDLIAEWIRRGGDLREAFAGCCDLFRAIERDESGGRRPRVALLGDVYVKYSAVVNQKLQQVVETLGGELIVPSMMEYPFHYYDADVRLHGDDPRHYRILGRVEQRYEKLAADLVGDQSEPDFAECVTLMEEYGIRHYLPGETSISVGRALYLLKNRLAEAIVHANPMFCCPGVVTASIYRKMQEDFGVPIVDIFYDGTGDPNRVLIPHLHYLGTVARRTP